MVKKPWGKSIITRSLWIIAVTCALSCPIANAADLSEKLKTAYLVNIAKFVFWPDKKTQITLCLHETANIYEHALSIDKISIGSGRQLVLIINPEDFSLCHIFYWDEISVQHRHDNLGKNTLEITDIPGEISMGIDVQFFIEKNRLRFSISQPPSKGGGLRISAELMRLSKRPEKP